MSFRKSAGDGRNLADRHPRSSNFLFFWIFLDFKLGLLKDPPGNGRYLGDTPSRISKFHFYVFDFLDFGEVFSEVRPEMGGTRVQEPMPGKLPFFKYISDVYVEFFCTGGPGSKA